MEKTAEGLFKGAYLGQKSRSLLFIDSWKPQIWDSKMLYTIENGTGGFNWMISVPQIVRIGKRWVVGHHHVHPFEFGFVFWGYKAIIESENRNAITIKVLTHFDISGIFNVSACFLLEPDGHPSKMVYPRHVGRCRM